MPSNLFTFAKPNVLEELVKINIKIVLIQNLKKIQGANNKCKPGMCIELIFTKEEGNIIKIRMTLYLEEKSSTTPPPPPKKKFSQLQILFLGGDGMWLRSTKGDQHCTEQFFILN